MVPPLVAPMLPTTGIWGRLTQELAGVFDAHGVCATSALAIASLTQTTAVVALSGSQPDQLDVWVASADGRLEQLRWPETHTIPAWASDLSGGRLVLRSEASRRELKDNYLWQRAERQIAVAPLPYPAGITAYTPRGLLCLIDPPPTETLLASDLVELAGLMTVFLDRAYLRQRTDQLSVEFDIISDISHSITSTLELERIVAETTAAVRRTLAVEAAIVGLAQGSGDNINLGKNANSLADSGRKLILSVAGWVVEAGEPLILTDVNNPGIGSTFMADLKQADAVRSLVCVPLQLDRRIIGVIAALNKRNGLFDDNDQRLLQAIAGPLAVALENARLHADVLAEKRRIESIFSSLAEGLVTTTPDAAITAANDAFVSLMGHDGGPLIGRNLIDLVQTAPAAFSDFFASVVSEPAGAPILACDLLRDGEEALPILIGAANILDAESLVRETIFVFSDLHQVREVERMRDDFFNNVIHELRTPLATILMYARLLREGKADNDVEKADRFLGIIERESNRLQMMVRQMLEVVEMGAGDLRRSAEPVFLNPLLETILPPLADRAREKGLAFQHEIESDLPPVLGRAETLHMIVRNLVENSIKFTQNGTIRVAAHPEGDFVRLEVSDDGVGIPDQALPNLFKRFYRAETAVERGIAGAGLGLYMVKEGVEQHGGRIAVTSVEGQGATFTIHLPTLKLE